jgi:hypothetical protein
VCRSNGKLRGEGTCDAAQEASGCGSRRHCGHGWGMVAAPQNASARLADTTVGATFFNVHFPWVNLALPYWCSERNRLGRYAALQFHALLNEKAPEVNLVLASC